MIADINRRLLDIYGMWDEDWIAQHPRCPDWIASKILSDKRRARLRRIARDALRIDGEERTSHLYRDTRPGIGSGRSAHWLDTGYERYAICAQAAHDSLGLSGEACRAVARGARAVDYPAHDQRWYPCEEPYPGGEYRLGERVDIALPAPYEHWCDWYAAAVVPRIAEHEALRRIARCMSDPEYQISGYLADSIMSWQQGQTGYEGCSGCESYDWHRAHPETWPLLLAHAPAGESGDGWEQVYPHERDRRAKLVAMGWHETFRPGDSIFTRTRPE
jgi:hypothetical protein